MQVARSFLAMRRPSSHLVIAGNAQKPIGDPRAHRLAWDHRGDPGGPGLRFIPGSVAGSTPAVASTFERSGSQFLQWIATLQP